MSDVEHVAHRKQVAKQQAEDIRELAERYTGDPHGYARALAARFPSPAPAGFAITPEYRAKLLAAVGIVEQAAVMDGTDRTPEPAADPVADRDAISKAIGIFSNNPSLSDRAVAKKAGIKHPSTLTRSGVYQRVKQTFAGDAPPNGKKNAKTRDVEAFE